MSMCECCPAVVNVMISLNNLQWACCCIYMVLLHTGTEENRMRHAGVTNPMHTGTTGGPTMGQQIKVSQQVNILHCMYVVGSCNNSINWILAWLMSCFGFCCHT
jgi:hypothetical protein